MNTLTENDVVDAVAAYLPSLGYLVEAMCTTTQQGIDIITLHNGTGRRLRVEAKGGTSSKDHTDRYGKGFNSGQVVSHVSRALYKAPVLLGENPGDDVALALPDDQQHPARIECIQSALEKLGIGVFFVAADRSVRRQSSSRTGG